MGGTCDTCGGEDKYKVLAWNLKIEDEGDDDV
jgi:hypothetical protein